jgi:hypothetical protein
MIDTPPEPSQSRLPAVQLIIAIALTLAVPAAIRFAPGAAAAGTVPRLPYLPALEGRRENAFHAHRIGELQRLDPGYVVIGDSMAGTRIDEHVLGRLTGRPVAPLLQAGSGPAFWYLAMKNWVIASGIRPRVVFIFFRDTNLTDTMFRLDEQFGWSLDSVATDAVETELNAAVTASLQGPLSSLQRLVESAYPTDGVRRRLEPAVSRAPVTWVTSSRRRQAELMSQANERFSLDHLRAMEAADFEADAVPDFDDVVGRSVLPLLLRDANAAGFQLCLVRVQRRPVDGQPPRQSRALRRYVDGLRAYVAAHGGVLHDDTGDPDMTLDMYADGDHIARAAKARYTTLFYERMRPLFAAAGPTP